jgi:hypothetical protein
MLPEQLEHARLENEFTKGRVKQLEAANKLAELQLRNTQGLQSDHLTTLANHMRPQQQQFSPEDLAQIEQLKPIAQTTPASMPRTDTDYQAQFVQRFGPQAQQTAQAPKPMGPPEQPIVVDQANVDLAGPELLQKVGFACLKYGKDEAGLKLLQLADEQRKTREMAAFYQQILATPNGDPQIRNQALAALGSLMMETGKSAQALQLLKGALPPSLLDLIEKTTRETRRILLRPKRAQRGKPSLTKAEAHARRAMFEAQPRQTATDAGIATTPSGERVRTTQQLHGSR